MATVGVSAFFSLALAVTSVALPILIVRAGYSLAEVGFFFSLSAVAQIGARIRIGPLMQLIPDKHLVTMAAMVMGVGSGLLVFFSAVWAIAVSQVLQGAARGLFWTGIQTHAVRTSTGAARGLAAINLASGAGVLVGPVLAGLLLESSARLAMGAAALGSVAAVVPAVLMARLPVFPRPAERKSGERVSRNPGVRAGAWGTASAGAWRGLVNAYVPVALHQAAHSSTTIGTVVAVANAARIAAGWTGRWVRSARFAVTLAAGTLATGLGLAVFGTTTEIIAVAGLALVASGLGMGLLETIGPAVAAESVDEDDRGDAIAAVGLSRSVATFAVPFGMAALLLAIPLAPAMAVAGVVVALPATYAIRHRER